MNDSPSLKIPFRSVMFAVVLVILGAFASMYGVRNDPQRTWPHLLLNGFYIVSLGVSAAFFLATQRATGARWSAALRRIPEAFMMVLPVAAILLALLFSARQSLFPWSHPGAFDQLTTPAGKVFYLRTPWVLGRIIAIFSLWTIFVLIFRRTSLAQDKMPERSLALHARLTRYGVLFIPIFAITFTLTAYDWLISLDPSWFSTMFAVYVFIGVFVQGIAAVTLATVQLKRRSALESVITERHLHDLGKMLLAFTTFWAYIWVCQYLLIWYGNIPEEVTHYLPRTNGPWLYLFALNLLANWVIPFVVLLSARTKRNPKVLITICTLLLLGHWLDLYLLVMPNFSPVGPNLGLKEIAIAAGYLALAYLLFIRSLARAPLTPLNDPILAYEAHGHANPLSYGSYGVRQ
jgi:hypothetical protein